MTREEHKAILALLEQCVDAGQQPVDVEADAIIRAFFVRNPEAAYRVTMLALSGHEPAAEAEIPVRRRSWLSAILEKRERLESSQHEVVSS
jgi:hypothetical protein